jgi:hypothetical protein
MIADTQEGDTVGENLNAAATLLDLMDGGYVLDALRKGGRYAVTGAIGKGPTAAVWKNVRAKMGREGMLSFGQHGHHWLIPQNGWGKIVPDVVKNHPFNIVGMPSREVHGRIHGSFKDKAQYDALHRWWHGTPAGAKAATAGALTHPAGAAWAARNDDQ